MGCNTSKETAVPVEGGNAEVHDDKADTKNDQENSKPESAKTVTLTSNGFILAKPDEENRSGDKNEATKDPELEGAAIKIQAAFRGHNTRKSMKQPAKHEEKPLTSQQDLDEEFNSDDKDLCDAATKIQASFRGHMIRKQMEKQENESDPPKDNKHEEEEELDIDLSDPELNKAAMKIQASFRGHLVRKDHEDEHSNSK